MKFKLLLLSPVLFSFQLLHAQDLILPLSLHLPEDSIASKQLVTSLNEFLTAAEDRNEENIGVLPSQRAETFILLDEIKGIRNEEKLKDEPFYKPYLTNVVSLKNGDYLIQISYMGFQQQMPVLRASFELMAYHTKDVFLFSSPLVKNTEDWQYEKRGSYIFHYRSSLNKKKAKELETLCSAFDIKLKLGNRVTE